MSLLFNACIALIIACTHSLLRSIMVCIHACIALRAYIHFFIHCFIHSWHACIACIALIIACISHQYQGDSKNTPFFERVEKITKDHCQNYGFDIDSAMTNLLECSNAHIQDQLPEGEWHAPAMVYPYCAFLHALQNSWFHPEKRTDKLTNRIILCYCPHFWPQLVDDIEEAKRELYIHKC